jgi:predicted O-linked N-acetylglucosamine transferase (SPINDLY family)
MRAALRERLAASPLMNAPEFARNVERAYRQMWQTWCEHGRAASPSPG